MTKQEQIEEIKRDIKKALEFDCSKGKCKTCKHKNEDNCEIPLITDYLIEQGYHKVPEGAVVLTKEEYIDLSRTYVKEQKAQAVKEFLEELKEKALSHCRIINCYELKFIETTIDELLYDWQGHAPVCKHELKIDELLKEYEK